MKTNTKTNLKRTLLLAFSGLLFVGFLASAIHNAQAQVGIALDSMQSNSERQFVCDNETLEGRYAGIGNGFAAPPGNPLLPFASLSLMTLDGAGNLTHKVTRSNGGNISRGNDVGTYTVNADCTGTMTIATPNPPFQLTFDLVVAD